jgi:hypothetical protein
MHHYTRSICAAIFAVTAQIFTPAAAVELPSYAASYELRLIRASASEGPRAAVGTLQSVFQETCDGWETRTRTVLDLAFRDSTNITNERYFDSWESKNGRDYKFSVHTFRNGRTIEAYSGRAEMKNLSGRAYYGAVGEKSGRVSEELVVELPEGTMLPVKHATTLLDRAEMGAPLFRTVVLDGASSTGPRVVSIAIGKRIEEYEVSTTLSDAKAEDIDKLLNTPSWRMSAARYNLYEERDTPDTELFLKLHKTGVIESFEQTFEDFSLSAHLVSLRHLESLKCG